MKKRLVLATGNKGKISEMKRILDEFHIEVISVKELENMPDVKEDGATFFENSRKKATEIAKAAGMFALADDSGLEVDALQGRPGVYSARYSGENATDLSNNEKLLEELKNVEESNRTARFKCVMVAASPEGKIISSEGSCEGVIANSMKGEGGFGYDPLFYVPAFGKTMAELSPDEKNSISHRGEAVKKIMELLPSFLSEV